MLAALRQVAREGDVTIPAVSAAAGVTRATFYNHFESLEAVSYTHLTLPTTPYV